MTLKEKDFVEIDYTGKLKDSGEVFDTTNKDVADENDLPDRDYKPLIFCLGQGHLLPGLEQALIGKDVGEHTIELEAEEAFGKKNPKLIKLVPTKQFVEQNVKPEPGLQVNIDGRLGIIRTVSGGRTTVDFNHPLASKAVVYDVKVLRVVEDPKEKISSFLKMTLNVDDAQIEVDGKKATIELPRKMPEQISDELAKRLKQVIDLEEFEFTAPEDGSSTDGDDKSE